MEENFFSEDDQEFSPPAVFEQDKTGHKFYVHLVYYEEDMIVFSTDRNPDPRTTGYTAFSYMLRHMGYNRVS